MIKKPEWLKVAYRESNTQMVREITEGGTLNTVCVEASCPNLGECYSSKTATFMVLGSVCTRNCGFCDVTTGRPLPADPEEPVQVAKAAAHLQLEHAVVTQVTRDDLEDGGAAHIAETIRQLRSYVPEASVEVLVSDLKGDTDALDTVLEAGPDVFGHNIEMPKELYSLARQQANYQRSLGVLRYAKENYPDVLTKTGFMVGMGETDDQIKSLLKDLAENKVDILTIGQYLQPSKDHVELKEYISPDKFDEMKTWAEEAGIPYVVSSPFVRSSYKAADAVQTLKKEHLS